MKKLFAFACFCFAAFPFTSSAEIIYTAGSGGPWILTTDPAVVATTFTLDLPGVAIVTGTQNKNGTYNFFNMFGDAFFSVRQHDSLSFFDTLNEGQTWSDRPANPTQDWGNIALMYNTNAYPGQGRTYQTGSPMYIPFYFADFTAGNDTKYGYLQLGVTATGVEGDFTATLTLAYTGWAYQNDGSEIAMAPITVPEPSTALLLLAGGAFVGVRRFIRRKKC